MYGFYKPLHNLQVSEKNCEIGMVQMRFSDGKIQHADYLTWMYFMVLHLGAIKPLEISSFTALVYPFDFFTWILTLLGTIVMFLILITMQKLWSHASGETYSPRFLYQGKNLGSIFSILIHCEYIVLFQIFVFQFSGQMRVGLVHGSLGMGLLMQEKVCSFFGSLGEAFF